MGFLPKKSSPEEGEEKSQIAEYESQMSRFRIIPEHEFEHKAMILETTKIPSNQTIQDIITKELQMANIKDDKLLRIYQIQMACILDWKDMGLWKEIGEWYFTRMISELQLSKSKNAMERMLQAGAIPMVSGILSGVKGIFGQKPQFSHEWEQQKQNEGFLRRESQYG